MVVCIIVEGSYPYITGGVSSWIHDLIRGLPEIKFKVLCIMPAQNADQEYKYTLPSNLIEIKTIYLNAYLNYEHKLIKKKVNISEREKEYLYEFLTFNDKCNWNEAIGIISDKSRIGNTIDFLQSEMFWDVVLRMYKERYINESFNTFFWTIRSMFLPFIDLFHKEPMEADIYHPVSTGYAGILGVWQHLRNRKPLLLTEHGIYAREREEEIIKAKWVTGIYKKLWIDFFYFISKAAYQESDRIVALFERNRAIQCELGASKDKTRIIANGVDLKRYSMEKHQHDGYNVGAILRIVPIKDVMTLIRAFKIVKEYVSAAKLYLIGPAEEDLEYYSSCKDLIKLLQLESHVIITGSVDVREYLRIIDVLVLTSISEGQPLVILEGMASGIPVVSTDVGGCRELLAGDNNEGACGFVTNLVSPSETAARIIKLLENSSLRDKMGISGRKRVERTYSREKFLKSYKNLYEELGQTNGGDRFYT